ncbi:MAG: TauD/TfdA family dioxygenase [Halarcobacter sp.]
MTNETFLNIMFEVETKGFCDLGVIKNFDLLKFAYKIGKPIPILPDEPKLGLVGARSLSSNLSSNEYATIYKENIPFHTDAAYYKIPPKYLILRLKKTSLSNRNTTVKKLFTNLSQEIVDILSKSLWKVRSPNGRYFIGKIIERRNNDFFIRYDSNSMVPYFKKNQYSREVLEGVLDKIQTFEITWEPEKIVILNNWKVLHGNSKVINDIDSSNRILERVLVEV